MLNFSTFVVPIENLVAIITPMINTIKRLEAMEGFLDDIITKLDQHIEVKFLLDLSKEIFSDRTTAWQFQRGMFYSKVETGLRVASDTLRRIKNEVRFELMDLRNIEKMRKEF